MNIPRVVTLVLMVTVVALWLPACGGGGSTETPADLPSDAGDAGDEGDAVPTALTVDDVVKSLGNELLLNTARIALGLWGVEIADGPSSSVNELPELAKILPTVPSEPLDEAFDIVCDPDQEIPFEGEGISGVYTCERSDDAVYGFVGLRFKASNPGLCFDHKVIGNWEYNGCASFYLRVNNDGAQHVVTLDISFNSTPMTVTLIDAAATASSDKDMSFASGDVFSIESLQGEILGAIIGGVFVIDRVIPIAATVMKDGTEIRCGVPPQPDPCVWTTDWARTHDLSCFFMEDTCVEACGGEANLCEGSFQWFEDSCHDCHLQEIADEVFCRCWMPVDDAECACHDAGLTACSALDRWVEEAGSCSAQTCGQQGGFCDPDGCCIVPDCDYMSCEFAGGMNCPAYGGDCCASMTEGQYYCDGVCCVPN